MITMLRILWEYWKIIIFVLNNKILFTYLRFQFDIIFAQLWNSVYDFLDINIYIYIYI